MIPLHVMDEITVRSPMYPFRFAPDAGGVDALLRDPFFLEAIYIASPLLYEECLKFRAGYLEREKDKTKLIHSLQRYYSRMCTRSTPFGLFSTCGTAGWGEHGQTDPEGRLMRHTRLDMHYLQKMASTISRLPFVREHIIYHTNNSIYQAGNEVRYIEYVYANHLRSYKISAVTFNRYIGKALAYARRGVTRRELADLMTAENISREDAARFVDNLVESQVLVSEFEAAVTGQEDFAVQILHRLESLAARSNNPEAWDLCTRFLSILGDVKALDAGGANDVSAYKGIIERLGEIQPVLEEGKTFHIDAYRDYCPGLQVRESARQEILEVVEYFMRVGEGMVILNRNLEDFKAKFRERYDTRTVSLVEALDTDLGIGYPVHRRMSAARLVDDIPLEHLPGDTRIQLNVVEKWLFEVIRDPRNAGAYAIDLSAQPQSPLYKADGPVNWNNLPSSMSVIFRVLDDASETLFVEGFYGPSASALIARFTYGHPGLREIVEKIVRAEEDYTENALLAEVAHMPDNRVTNVIMHPPFRSCEIPYLASPGVEASERIDIDDLYLRLEGSQLVLFSRSRNQVVLPRKTNMHNHAINTLPLYNFLGDLQEQGAERSLTFFGGELLKLYVFLPRFCYKNTIVSPATWSLTPSIMVQLAERSEEGLRHIRELYGIPDLVLYVDGDNELLVDFTDQASTQVWLNLVRSKQAVVLKEFLSESGFRRQYIASVLHTEKKRYALPESTDAPALPIRNFPLGSEWLYLKYYCGTGSVDLVLTEIIARALQEISERGLIKKWFFIKYHDPDYHIRLRMQMITPESMPAILRILEDALSRPGQKHLVWKSQPDVYVREVERYGPHTIDLCESIFHVDSMITIGMLPLLGKDPEGKVAFLWGSKMVEDLLGAFGMTTEEKSAFADQARKSFQVEFHAGKDTTDWVNARYTRFKTELGQVLSGVAPGEKNRHLYFLLEQKLRMQIPLIDQIMAIRGDGRLHISLESLVSSLVHMMLNRLITQKERLHEFLLYEMLYRHFQMVQWKRRNEMSRP